MTGSWTAAQIWEVWEQRGGEWFMTITDEGGTPKANQPFGEFELRNPYAVLPAQVIYDDYPQGAWFVWKAQVLYLFEQVADYLKYLFALLLLIFGVVLSRRWRGEP